jgi:hypothetical protein
MAMSDSKASDFELVGKWEKERAELMGDTRVGWGGKIKWLELKIWW